MAGLKYPYTFLRTSVDKIRKKKGQHHARDKSSTLTGSRNDVPFLIINSITCVLLRIAQHYVLQQRYFAAALGIHGVGHQVEVRGRQEVGHGDPEDRQIGRHAGRVHPEIAGEHLVRLQPELLMEPAVVSRHALDLEDLRALIERRLDGAVVQGIRFHCTDTFRTLIFSLEKGIFISRINVLITQPSRKRDKKKYKVAQWGVQREGRYD